MNFKHEQNEKPGSVLDFRVFLFRLCKVAYTFRLLLPVVSVQPFANTVANYVYFHIVYLVQKISLKFIISAESVQNQQKTVDFFSIRVYLKIKIWIQNQISKIINHKMKDKIQITGKLLRQTIGIAFAGYGSRDKKTGIYDKAKRRTDLTNEEVER